MPRWTPGLAAALLAGTLAHAATDVTGLYGVADGCGDVPLESPLGLPYVEHCLRGERFAGYTSLSLVQNGDKVCGYYSRCEGINCRRVHAGRLAGTVSDGKLRLFAEDSHRSEGLAESWELKVLAGGLSESGPNPYYVRRAARLLDAKLPGACAPQLPARPELREGELQAAGLPGDGALSDAFIPQAEQRTPAPAAHGVRLSRVGAQGGGWADARTGSANHVPRQFTVRNDTAAAWQVAAMHPEICQEFLKEAAGYEAFRGEISSESIALPAGATRDFISCKGSRWTFRKEH